MSDAAMFYDSDDDLLLTAAKTNKNRNDPRPRRPSISKSAESAVRLLLKSATTSSSSKSITGKVQPASPSVWSKIKKLPSAAATSPSTEPVGNTPSLAASASGDVNTPKSPKITLKNVKNAASKFIRQKKAADRRLHLHKESSMHFLYLERKVDTHHKVMESILQQQAKDDLLGSFVSTRNNSRLFSNNLSSSAMNLNLHLNSSNSSSGGSSSTKPMHRRRQSYPSADHDMWREAVRDNIFV
jgi:hypothetical protein